MRFETNEIIIEVGLVGGSASCLLIYPNPILRNVRAVWKGAPADCTKAGRGLRIDFAQPPQLEQRLDVYKPSAGDSADDDTTEKLVNRFLQAQAAYFAGQITLETVEAI